MAPKLVLTYFDVPALAEPVRLALAMSGLEWEDKRLSGEEFNAIKSTLPYNQLPILEVDGKVIPQSQALLRLVGKLGGGLYPTDPIQAAYADAAMDAVTDNHFLFMRPSVHENDPEKKAELRKAMLENLTNAWLPNLEKALKEAGGEYFADGKLSIGDLGIVCRLNWIKAGVLDGIPSTIVDGFPLLSALVTRVMSEPKITAYKESRQK